MPKKKAELVGPGGVPIRKHAPAYNFPQAIQIWVGAPKVGKTSTLAALSQIAEEYGLSDEVNPFIILFEPGSGGVELNCTSEKCPCGGKKNCSNCNGTGTRRKILSTLEEIEEWFQWAAESPFNPIGIDTGDAMYQAIADAVCVRLGIADPTQTDHGIAWVQIFDEFREKLGILTGAGKGVIVVMHVYHQERRVKGGTIQTATFSVSGKSRPYLAGLANQILHFEVLPDGEGDKHVITTRSRSGVEAGDHWGVFPEELDRGDSPETAAKAILSCFYELED
jgi:hypothetical protein